MVEDSADTTMRSSFGSCIEAHFDLFLPSGIAGLLI